MLILYHGRPKCLTGRLEKEIKTYDILDHLGISYDCVDHEPAMTMEVCNDIDVALQATICKNLFLCNRQHTQFYLLMIPNQKRFKTKDLSKQLGIARLSFTDAAAMKEMLDVTPGSVSVMDLMNDVEGRVHLLIDADLLQSREVGVHPCINTTSIRLKVVDLIDKVLPALRHEPTYVTLPPAEKDEEI